MARSSYWATSEGKGGLGPTQEIPFVKSKTHLPAGQGELFANRRMPAPESSQGNRSLKPICQAAENRIRDAFPRPENHWHQSSKCRPIGNASQWDVPCERP